MNSPPARGPSFPLWGWILLAAALAGCGALVGGLHLLLAFFPLPVLACACAPGRRHLPAAILATLASVLVLSAGRDGFVIRLYPLVAALLSGGATYCAAEALHRRLAAPVRAGLIPAPTGAEAATPLTLPESPADRYRTLVEQSPDLAAVLDRGGRFLNVSPSARELLGREPAELETMWMSDLVHADDLQRAREVLGELVRREGLCTEATMRLRHRDGAWRVLSAHGRAFQGADRQLEILLVARDVTARQEMQDQLERRAFADPVTGLANRALLVNRLEYSLAELGRSGGLVALLFLDLDHFKQINDAFGHGIGDELLQRVGFRLRECVREVDTVARFGGDEFVVLLPRLVHESDATRVSTRILENLCSPILLGAREVAISASLGIALGTRRERADELLRNADIALYRAKASGRGKYVVFDAAMDAEVNRRRELETALADAVPKAELCLHFQPIVEIVTGKPTAVEALVRWKHPQLGLLDPGQFLPIADESDLLSRISEWIWREAARQIRQWNTQRPADAPLELCLNLTTREFQNPSLARDIEHLLNDTGMNPAALRLEIVEGALLAEIEPACRKLRGLRALGIQITLDDFGVGATSLTGLVELSADWLKVDRTLIRGIANNPAAQKLVQAIAASTAHIGCRLCAEGVETRADLDVVTQLGFHEVQGFYFAHPSPAEELHALIE